MKYHESSPGPSLAGVVRCYWSLQDTHTADAPPEPVLPDGCPEIVFNLASRFRRYDRDGEKSLQPRSLISGQLSTSILIGPTGPVNLFGIRFEPAGARIVLRFPLDELTDRIEDVASLIGRSESILHERLGLTPSFEGRIALIEEFLTGRISSAEEIPGEIPFAVNSLSSNDISVARLAREIGWSQRRLERQFGVWVGLRPKMFARVSRFRRLMHMLEAGAADLVDAAVACGYYDQSHMNHEFRHFTGSSPTRFMNTSHPISELFVAGT